MSLGLVALDCPSCGSALHGEGMDTIFFCSHCGDAAVLEESGLRMVDSSALLPAAGRAAALWRPAWLIEGSVTVRDRVRSGGRPSAGWQGPRTFVIPAFELPLRDTVRLARGLSEPGAATAEVPRAPIHGGSLALEDAVTLARHIVVGDEVRKSDHLASVTVEIEVLASRLVAIPLERASSGLRCAVTGMMLGQ